MNVEDVAFDERFRGVVIFDDLSNDDANKLIRQIAKKGQRENSATQARSEYVAERKFGKSLVERLKQEKQSAPTENHGKTVTQRKIYPEDAGEANVLDEHMEEDTVSTEEQNLAQQLRNLCNANGEERQETLPKSAQVIFEMGELYLKKAGETKGMRKKLNFLKCATLLHGARVRFEALNLPKKQQEIAIALFKLNSKFLSDVNVTVELNSEVRQNTVLHDLSASLYAKIENVRKRVSRKLEALLPISDDIDLQEVLIRQKEKIDQVRELCDENTSEYVKLMCQVAEDCIAILGDAPCKYALTGLGSMARREITLYSDFEHVIVLEDGVDGQKNYRYIKEYFRWFAVVFQVIIIGLGETFIRSIGVKSINELASTEKSKNWFLDKYTPVGISFDGMVPHSCNNPLGRQESTKHRKHAVELIQPAGNMAKFLTRAEELKNGYYLKDVLSGTCFVFGCEEVYGRFLEQAREILHNEGKNSRISEQLTKIVTNCNEVVKGSNMVQNPIKNYDFKASTYRPITALLSYLARIANIDKNSSFDVVDSLHSAKIIDDEWAHALNFTVAVANEGRMRVYLSKDGQRNASTPRDVVKLVGKRTASYTYMVIRNLVGEITDVQTIGNNIAPFKSFEFCASYEDWEIEACMNFGHFEEAVAKTTRKMNGILLQWKSGAETDEKKVNQHLSRLLHVFQQSCLRISHTNIERRFEFQRKMEWACTRVFILRPANVTLEFLSAQNLAFLCFHQRRSKEGIAMTTKWFQMYDDYNLKDEMGARNLAFLRMMDIRLKEDTLEEDALIMHLISVLLNRKPLERGERFFIEIGIAHAQLRKGNKEKNYEVFCTGKQKLGEITLELKRNAAYISRLVYQALLETIRDVQQKAVLHQDLRATAELLAETQEDDYAREIDLLPTDERKMKIVEQNLAAHVDDHPYCAKYLDEQSPQIQARFSPMLVAMLSQDIFATSSSREMNSILEHAVKLATMSVKTMPENPRRDVIARLCGVLMMTVFESAQNRQVADVIKLYHNCPIKVRYFGPLQPMIYGYFQAKMAHLDQNELPSCEAESITADYVNQLMRMEISQRAIFRSLTTVQESERIRKAFNTAVDSFVGLRFQECANILWKILRGRRLGKKRCIHLLNAVLLVFIVSRKFRAPKTYIRELRDISHRQLIEVSTAHGNQFTKTMGLRFREIHLLLVKVDGHIIQAHNLAVDCHPISVKKCGQLLWKIVNFSNYPNAEKFVRRKSLRCLSHVTYTEVRYRNARK